MHTCGKVTDGEKTISLTVVYVHSVRCNLFIIINLDFFFPQYMWTCVNIIKKDIIKST